MYLRTGLLASILFAAANAAAADHVVQVGGAGGNVFTPANVDVLVGDTVTFTNTALPGGGFGFHNAASVNQDPAAGFVFRCAVDCGANGGGSNEGWSSTITIPPSAAHQTINYLCQVHGQAMSGTISVTNPVELQTFEID